MTKFLSFVLLSASLLSASHALASELKIVTYNILFQFSWDLMDRWGIPRWGERKATMAKFLKKQDADLIGLQELSPFQFNDLTRALGSYDGFYFIGPSPIFLVNQYPDAVVLLRRSRFELLGQGSIWFSGRPHEAYSTSFGNTMPRLLYWVHVKDKQTAQSFYFASTHVDNGAGIKEKMVRVAATELKKLVGSEPAIVVGDFNLPSQHPALEPLAEQFADACPAAAGQTSHLAGEGVIDHIFVNGFSSKGCAILNPQREGAPLSDHFPVTATLSDEAGH